MMRNTIAVATGRLMEVSVSGMEGEGAGRGKRRVTDEDAVSWRRGPVGRRG